MDDWIGGCGLPGGLLLGGYQGLPGPTSAYQDLPGKVFECGVRSEECGVVN